jgi:hypothetical protein
MVSEGDCGVDAELSHDCGDTCVTLSEANNVRRSFNAALDELQSSGEAVAS